MTATTEAIGPSTALATIRAYAALTKPRIVELLVVTAVPTMFLAAGGVPRLPVAAATVVGGALAAGGANALNCYLDRDIDGVMGRTARRPLVRHSVAPVPALLFGLALGILATLLLGLAVNWLAAALADAAILFYVFVYTVWLKRRSASNIVIGGAAGCFPVLVAWAGVTGTVGWPALVLFLVIFLWTPPHFWALAMKFRNDYASARVPMLPVVAPPATVTRRIVVYSYLMVAASLALTPAAGWAYAGLAAALGGHFLAEAHRLHRLTVSGRGAKPIRLFHLSISYLTLLFTAVAVAAFLP